jgi:hypothetical protein
MRYAPRIALGCLLSLALAVAGCGSKTGAVRGKVYYKNQTLPSGTVTFQSKDQTVARSATIQADGSYTIERMPVGPVIITVVTQNTVPGMAGGEGAKGKMNASAMGGPADAPKGESAAAANAVRIPREYSDASNSPLKYEVKSGSQDHDIEVK